MNTSASSPAAPIPTQSVFSRPAALVGGGIGLIALTAVATTLALRATAPSDGDAPSATPAPLVAQATTPPQAPADFPDKMAASLPSPVERASTTPRASAAAKPAHVQRGSVKATEPSARAASVCASCGKVESVHAVKQKGEGSGLGVVGGAVVGGLLGSQVGGGSGKNVATVLGAVGGGVAGNEVEKRARATTAYEVRVRMDDGSLRTVRQGTAPAVGQKVTVEGSTLRTRSSTS
ncbi:MAG: glycine zipper 2TM domain-containing protein [Pseudomonadota bacterium]